MSQSAVSVFVVVVTLLLIAFDIYLATDSIKSNTYSARIRHWGREWRWFPFALSLSLGVLIGHWFV